MLRDSVAGLVSLHADGYDTVIAAVSGGADSVCLLHSLHTVCKELGMRLCACHVNHQLRGEESDRDEMFVRRLCRFLEVPLYVTRVDVKALCQKHESIELAARRVRYDFFDHLSRQYQALIATAHTASDNCETVLINLIRGTALSGICGIPPRRGNIIRPLLYCTREDIERYCRDNELDFVTDSTNLSDDYTRNKIRHNIIPLIKEINPAFSAAVSRLTETVAIDDRYLDDIAARALKSAKCCDGYKVLPLSELDECILRRCAVMLLQKGEIPVSRLAVDSCVKIIQQRQGKINPCKYKFIQIRKKILYITTDYSKYRKTPQK